MIPFAISEEVAFLATKYQCFAIQASPRRVFYSNRTTVHREAVFIMIVSQIYLVLIGHWGTGKGGSGIGANNRTDRIFAGENQAVSYTSAVFSIKFCSRY